MKISELIKQLEEFKAQHGDVEACFTWGDSFFEIDEVEYAERQRIERDPCCLLTRE